MVSGNAVTLSGTLDTILAAAGPGGAPAVANGTITLSGSNPIAIAAGQTLSLGVSNGYTLIINPDPLVFSNSGTISIGPGNVSLQAVNLGASAGTLSASSGGTLTMVGPVNSGVYAPAAGGTVILSGSVSGGTYSPAAGGTVLLIGPYSGPLTNLAPSPGSNLVIYNNLSAGTLNVGSGLAYYAFSSTSFGPATLEFSGGTLGEPRP